MHLLIFSDIHQDWDALRKLVQKEADFYICLGDLTKCGEGLWQAGEILAPLKEKLYLLPGNNETVWDIQSLCQKYGFFNFHQKMEKVGDYIFAGLGYSIPTPFNTPGEMTEEEFEKALKKFEGWKNLFLFCHNPPKNSQLDITSSDLHVGSQAIREFIEKNKPIYFFSGHIHENAGKIQRIGKTTCFSLGPKGLDFYV